MRQAGVIAAAGLYALRNNIESLSDDHDKALELSDVLSTKFGSENIKCYTNMLHLSLGEEMYESLANYLGQNGVTVGRPRWVVHRDISPTALKKITRLLKAFKLS